MNTLPPTPSEDTQAWLQGQLRGLPSPPAPPAGLWRRVDRSLVRRRRVRRTAAALGLAAALAMLAVLPGLQQPAPATAPNLVQPAAVAPDLLAALHVELRDIDRQLEAAYLGGDERERIARLWQLRQRIEQRLEDPSRAQPQLIHL